MMKRLEYPMNHEWHVCINKFNAGKFSKPDYSRWMYEAKTMADEIPRMAMLFAMERKKELPQEHQQCSQSEVEPIPANHLTCCLGVKCAECPQLLSLEGMERAMPEDIDAAKAWTCATHIVSKGGDPAGEGYILTVGDRMYWERVYDNLIRSEG